MTMTQKILAAHAGLDKVEAGQLIKCKLDMVLGNDVTTPVAINEFEKAGFTSVFDNTKISMVMDHFTPNKDIKSATNSLQCRTFAGKYNIKNYYDVGEMGIEHALLPEKGIVASGECIIGADSHTCTYGALGAFSTGVGSTDMCAGMATGEAWFKVPSAIKFNLTGKLNEYVMGKDVILHIIGMIGVDGALYKSMEFSGEGLKSLSMDDRLSMANMAIEAGTNGRLEDMAMAAKILKGRHVAKNVRCIVIPATQQVYLDCIKNGYMETFIEAGCAVSTPTCGPCLGGHMGILAKGERAVATTNRNFVGRMGHPESEVYLASPAVAAASAITGKISDPSEVM